MTDATDLHRHTLIGYVPDLLYAPELRYLGEIDKALSPTVQSSSINAQHRLIASGTGIGVLPDFIGAQDAELDRLLPAQRITRSFFAVTHEDNRRLRRVVAFLNWLGPLLVRERATLLDRAGSLHRVVRLVTMRWPWPEALSGAASPTCRKA